MGPGPRLRALLAAATAAIGMGAVTAALLPANAAGFGVASSGGFFTVDTGAGLTFKVSQSNGDMTSLMFHGTELQNASSPGLGPPDGAPPVSAVQRPTSPPARDAAASRPPPR